MWATVIEPDGTEGISMTVEAAIRWCQEHQGWTWRYCEANEVYV